MHLTTPHLNTAHTLMLNVSFILTEQWWSEVSFGVGVKVGIGDAHLRAVVELPVGGIASGGSQ